MSRTLARARGTALALVVLVALGCGGELERERGAADGGAVVQARTPGGASAGRVVSTVDGEAITLEEVEEVARETGLTPLEALRRLQEERVLVARAEAAGMGDDPEVRDAVRRASVRALLEARVEREVRPESIPAARIAERIEAQRGRWSRPERRRVTHVLARLEESAPPEADAAAERFARRAVEALSAAGDAVAAAHAMRDEDDPRRTFRVQVEDLPPVARDERLVPEFLEAAFSRSDAGVVPSPVRTRFGWHAIVVTEIVPPWEAPQGEVEDLVREELLVEARAARLDELVQELAEETPVARDEQAIERALSADLEPPPEGGGAGR